MAVSPTPQEQPDFLAAALSYAEGGWPIFPIWAANGLDICACPKAGACDSPGKHPIAHLVPRGHTEATTNELDIRRWWKAEPNANIGLAIPSGFVVVDIDGEPGVEALRQAGYAMPRTAIQSTGRGWHYVYRTIGEFRNRHDLMKKVDLKGTGGYIVVAPSVHHTGTAYTWKVPLKEVATAPDWIAEAIKAAKEATRTDYDRVNVAEVLSGVPEGKRDVEIFRLACKLRQADIPEDVAIRLVQEAAANCVPAFDPDVAESKVKWAYAAYPSGKGLSNLPRHVTPLGSDSVMVEFENIARFVFSDMAKVGRELVCQMEVTSLQQGTVEEPYVQRVNLLSQSALESARRVIEAIYGKGNWTAMLARAAANAHDAYLKVDRSVKASMIVAPKALGYVVTERVPDNGTTIFFGAGSSTKTFQVMQMGLAVSNGLPWLGCPTKKARCLFVDYETGQETFGYRLRRLALGMGLDPSAADDILYWWADGVPFSDLADALKRCCDENQIGLVFLDHIAVACGANPLEPHAANEFYRAVSRINRPMVALAHITGEGEYDPSKAHRPFGTVFWSNGARRTYFVLRRQEQGASEAEIGFFPRKVNDGVKPYDFGATVRFNDPGGPIEILPTSGRQMDVQQVIAQARSNGAEQVIYEALTEPMTEQQIAQATGLSLRKLEDVLPAYPDMFRLVERGGGRGRKNVWDRTYPDGAITEPTPEPSGPIEQAPPEDDWRF